MKWKSIIGGMIVALYIPCNISNALCDEWTAKDTYYEVAALTTIAMDYMQTRNMVKHGFNYDGKDYKEYNPIMGSRPSSQTVDLYFLSTAVVHAGVAYLLPSKYRRWFQVGTVVLELGVVAGNSQEILRKNRSPSEAKE